MDVDDTVDRHASPRLRFGRAPARIAAACALLYLGAASSGCRFFEEEEEEGAIPACDTCSMKREFEGTFPDIPEELEEAFEVGDENFEKVFGIDEGLGPIFVTRGCEQCHIADGKGTPDQMVTRFSMLGAEEGVDDPSTYALGGDQLQNHSIPDAIAEEVPDGAMTSRRLPPRVVGLGLLEAVSDDALLELIEQQEEESGGVITGRLNTISGEWPFPSTWVPNALDIPPAYQDPYVPESMGGGFPTTGRFGLKANFATLLQVVAHAYHQDIGMTSPWLPIEDPNPQDGSISTGDHVPDPELTVAHVNRTVMYIRLLDPPAREELTPEIEAGEELFDNMQCDLCHRPTLTTGRTPIEALSEVTFHPYTDLLLHDMGPELADNRPDQDAGGSEWRTPPLWGTGILDEITPGGEAFFLHDGRTTDVVEAILLHGGEAQAARDAFEALSDQDKENVLAFLDSL